MFGTSKRLRGRIPQQHGKNRFQRRRDEVPSGRSFDRYCGRNLGHVQLMILFTFCLWVFWRTIQVPEFLLETQPTTIESSYSSPSQSNRLKGDELSGRIHLASPGNITIVEKKSGLKSIQDEADTSDADSVTKETTVWLPTNDVHYEVCFLTASYAKSPELADRPPDVTAIIEENPTFQFFAFTNLQELDAPGWKIIVKDFMHNTTHSKFRRFITQSRWPKFMAWSHPTILTCQVVFYMDAYCSPKSKHSLLYKRLASTLTQSQYGLAQNKHEYSGGNLYQEFERILSKQKDIPSNVNASLIWLTAQPDFNPNCTMYENHYIAYDPRNPFVQRAMNFFWDHYSLEQDSWRDQPLWCYVLDRYNITPTRLGTPKKLFREYFKRMGPGGHRYDEKTENNSVIVV